MKIDQRPLHSDGMTLLLSFVSTSDQSSLCDWLGDSSDSCTVLPNHLTAKSIADLRPALHSPHISCPNRHHLRRHRLLSFLCSHETRNRCCANECFPANVIQTVEKPRYCHAWLESSHEIFVPRLNLRSCASVGGMCSPKLLIYIEVPL